MNLTVPLDTDEAIALRRMAAEMNTELPEAAQAALREFLFEAGYLEIEEADNDDGDG